MLYIIAFIIGYFSGYFVRGYSVENKPVVAPTNKVPEQSRLNLIFAPQFGSRKDKRPYLSAKRRKKLYMQEYYQRNKERLNAQHRAYHEKQKIKNKELVTSTSTQS